MKIKMGKKISPIPCTKVEQKTVKDWFQKINEELDELKENALVLATLESTAGKTTDNYTEDEQQLAEEGADVITVITSFLETMGIDEEMRQAAQQCVNAKNRERGRF